MKHNINNNRLPVKASDYITQPIETSYVAVGEYILGYFAKQWRAKAKQISFENKCIQLLSGKVSTIGYSPELWNIISNGK